MDFDGRLRVPALPAAEAPLLIGAGRWETDPRPHAEEPYDGKIENPTIFGDTLAPTTIRSLGDDGVTPHELPTAKLLAAWDFSVTTGLGEIADTSSNQLNAAPINTPMRAATSHRWLGDEHDFRRAPDQYAAIHFHSDDVTDAGWDRDFELRIPANLASGAYAVRLVAGTETDDVPFYVRPTRTSRSQVAFLAPTFTYLAYGNKNSRLRAAAATDQIRRDPTGAYLATHPELGRSLYDRHVDGSGCCYSSRMRPIVEMRSEYRYPGSDDPRHFSADLLFLQWLERMGHRYDVITDEDLHTSGREALSGYRVVVTGSHPEYCTEAMLDALEDYVSDGGKLMYLGGNGFYWVTSVDHTRPHIIEVRRGIAGTRPWSSEPGEQHHSTTGELGGLWRHRGRAPNRLVGVGFCAQGRGSASGYVRQPGSFQADVGFIFRNVAADEVIGEFGSILGGAAGDEVDRMDVDFGGDQICCGPTVRVATAPTAVLLASSNNLDDSYVMAVEEANHTLRASDPTNAGQARADMVYQTRPNGGAIFAVGSMNWFGSLAFNGDDNNVSRITENVLVRFIGN